MGLLAEFDGRFELPLLIEDGIDVGALMIDNGFIRHDENLDVRNVIFRAWEGPRSQEFILHSREPDVIEITRSCQRAVLGLLNTRFPARA
jgi:hypothetical protein